MDASSNLASLSSRYAIGPRTMFERTSESFDATAANGVAVGIDIHSAKERARALATARLAHDLQGDHVRRIYEMGTFADGSCFVVRERTTSNLEATLRARGSIPLRQAVGWTLDAAEAVAEAHAMGIAHGDLRAANVHLARQGDGSSILKVVWTDAGILDATKADMARDVADLGKLLCFLLTGKIDPREADGAPTFPSDVAHAVAKAISPPDSGGFEDVDAFARALAPSGPVGHPSPRNIDFLFARAGMLKVPTAPPPREVPASRPVPSSRDMLAEDWFSRARSSLSGHVPGGPSSSLSGTWDVPRQSGSNKGFILATVSVITLVMGATVIAATTGNLPRWTGSAPPEESSRTMLTSAESREPVDTSPPTSNATPTTAPIVHTTELPDAPPASASTSPPPVESAPLPKLEPRRMTTVPRTSAPAVGSATAAARPRAGRDTNVQAPASATTSEVNAPAAPLGAASSEADGAATPPGQNMVAPAPTTAPIPTVPAGSLPPDSLPPGVVAPAPSESMPAPSSDDATTP